MKKRAKWWERIVLFVRNWEGILDPSGTRAPIIGLLFIQAPAGPENKDSVCSQEWWRRETRAGSEDPITTLMLESTTAFFLKKCPSLSCLLDVPHHFKAAFIKPQTLKNWKLALNRKLKQKAGWSDIEHVKNPTTDKTAQSEMGNLN